MIGRESEGPEGYMNQPRRAAAEDPRVQARRDQAGVDRRVQALSHPDGSSLVSVLVAGFITFVILAMSPFLLIPMFSQFRSDDDGEIGPLFLFLPVFSVLHLLVSLIGSIVLSVISLALVITRRWRPFPDRLPYVLSLPIAWLLILPSKLEHGGAWTEWLILGAVTAGFFCIHWRVFAWTRSIWD